MISNYGRSIWQALCKISPYYRPSLFMDAAECLWSAQLFILHCYFVLHLLHVKCDTWVCLCDRGNRGSWKWSVVHHLPIPLECYFTMSFAQHEWYCNQAFEGVASLFLKIRNRLITALSWIPSRSHGASIELRSKYEHVVKINEDILHWKYQTFPGYIYCL